jgi:hypothetical protein
VTSAGQHDDIPSRWIFQIKGLRGVVYSGALSEDVEIVTMQMNWMLKSCLTGCELFERLVGSFIERLRGQRRQAPEEDSQRVRLSDKNVNNDRF